MPRQGDARILRYAPTRGLGRSGTENREPVVALALRSTSSAPRYSRSLGAKTTGFAPPAVPTGFRLFPRCKTRLKIKTVSQQDYATGAAAMRIGARASKERRRLAEEFCAGFLCHCAPDPNDDESRHRPRGTVCSDKPSIQRTFFRKLRAYWPRPMEPRRSNSASRC